MSVSVLLVISEDGRGAREDCNIFYANYAVLTAPTREMIDKAMAWASGQEMMRDAELTRFRQEMGARGVEVTLPDLTFEVRES